MTSNTANQESLDIAIIGGGIAGLCLAIGLLKQPKNKVTIYESAHHFGEIGAGVSIGPSAIRAMSSIDAAIKEGFDRVATTNAWEDKKNVWFDYRFGEGEKAGEKFASIRIDSPENYAGVHRAKFLDELIKLIPEDVAKFGKRVTVIQTIDEGKKVLLKFKDGSEATHGCVIGCDGIHSEARKFVLGKDDPAASAVFSGKYCHRGLAPMEKAIEVLGEEMAVNSQMYLGHHAHILTFPVEHGKVFNVVAFSSCETWEHPRWVVGSEAKDINKDFENFRGPAKAVISLMQDTDIWALFDHPPARTFYSGNVAIIGDAAHATTPHQGSGAGMAIEDAFVLSNLIAKVQKPEQVQQAFKAFNTVRLHRGHELTRTSRECGWLWEFEHPEIGDDLDRFRENLSTRMTWIWHEDLNAELQKGLEAMNV